MAAARARNSLPAGLAKLRDRCPACCCRADCGRRASGVTTGICKASPTRRRCAVRRQPGGSGQTRRASGGTPGGVVEPWQAVPAAHDRLGQRSGRSGRASPASPRRHGGRRPAPGPGSASRLASTPGGRSLPVETSKMHEALPGPRCPRRRRGDEPPSPSRKRSRSTVDDQGAPTGRAGSSSIPTPSARNEHVAR